MSSEPKVCDAKLFYNEKGEIVDYSVYERHEVRLAKEFIKFNERCFVRLLGDMRAYNYVIVPIHDFDKVIYKIRAIDFDQQCYEGRFKVYRPQFFKENLPMVDLVKSQLTQTSIDQYKIEERATLARRILGNETRLTQLLKCMLNDHISTLDKVEQLRQEVYDLTRQASFLKSRSMGEIMQAAFHFVRRNYENHEMLRISD